MLVAEDTDEMESDEFLTVTERGYWKEDRQVIYYRVQYNSSVYSDALYDVYGVTFPPTIKNGVRKRRAEYLAGRICCLRILHHAGIAGEVSSQFPSRAPKWPDQVNGTITHTGNHALAVICPRELGYIGVDLEHLDEASLLESAEIIASEAPDLTPSQLLINFSAKESLFKASYPQINFYFGFECATVKEIGDSETKYSDTIFGRLESQSTHTISSVLGGRHIFTGSYSYNCKSLLITTLVFDPQAEN